MFPDHWPASHMNGEDLMRQEFEGLGDMGAGAFLIPASPLQTPVGSLHSSPLGSHAESLGDAVRSSVAAVPCAHTRAALQMVVSMIDQTRFPHGDAIHQNVLRLLSHLGAVPSVRQRSPLSSGMSSPGSSASKHVCDIGMFGKPFCPWCKSSNFLNEKNLVAHLNDAILKIGVPASNPKSCRYSALQHNSMMGIAGDTVDHSAAKAFLLGYRSCFLASGGSFDLARSARASDYLTSAAGVGKAPE